jgi:glyoxylase-like metal-dependent hydrolase (beta-lactamase superfamily II)
VLEVYAKKVGEGLYLLDTMALGQPGTVAAYLVKGPKPTLVDCGYASSYRNVLDGLAEAGVPPSEVRYVIPTHVHLDHAGATGSLLKSMPKAEVVAHEKSVPHLVDPARLIESATRVFGEEIMALYGRPEPVPADRVTPVGDETHVELGAGVTATLTHAPGHAPHQISVMLEKQGVMLTADAVGIVYPGMKTLIPTTPPPSLDPGALTATVRKLEQMDPKTILAPHFGARKDTGWVFGQTKEKVAAWVDGLRKMKKEGADFGRMTEEMVAEVAREEGTTELPLYAQVSVRTSVMGINHFLEKNP